MDLILRPFAWLLLQMYKLVGNYGIALFLFAILVKLILFPFSLKGKKSMIKMNMLNSETQKLQKKYGKDQIRYNEELQKLYQRENVNPMSGCLWSLIPLFILLPLYSVIRQPLKYMMDLGAEQIAKVAEILDWGQVSIDMGWVKKAVDAASNAYSSGAYNELYLASMINESNLTVAQAAAGEGSGLFAMNFDFLGIDLSQVPNWQFWSNGLDWSTIGLFLLVVVSALTGILSTRISTKTNNMNNGQEANDQVARTNRTMMWMMPVMSIWIGFMMPGLLNIYWIANNILAVAQELIASKILKKDYEKAARARQEAAAQAKEEEKTRRRELAEKRAREAEEARKNKKKAAELKASEDKKDTANIDASRIGIRSYARGRSYDPDRFGGVTPYHDPDVAAKEKAEKRAMEAEEAKKAKKGKTEEAVAEKPAAVVEPMTEEVVAAPVSEETVEEAAEPAAEDTKAKE